MEWKPNRNRIDAGANHIVYVFFAVVVCAEQPLAHGLLRRFVPKQLIGRAANKRQVVVADLFKMLFVEVHAAPVNEVFKTLRFHDFVVGRLQPLRHLLSFFLRGSSDALRQHFLG